MHIFFFGMWDIKQTVVGGGGGGRASFLYHATAYAAELKAQGSRQERQLIKR